MPRRPARLVVALVLVLGLVACLPADLLEATLSGRLLDPDGQPVAGAVVYVPEGAGAAAIAAAQVGSDCQPPSQPAVAATCTDAQGRYALTVVTPLFGSLQLVFERLYWQRIVDVELGLRVPGEPVDVPDATFEALAPSEELEAAVRFALPGLQDFTLLALNDEKAIVDLVARAGTVDANVEPISITLPIRQPDGRIAYVPWTVYHHDMRELGVTDCAIDPDTFQDVDCQEVSGPSLTFQGMPWLTAEEVRSLFIGETEKNLADETLHQMSVLAVIGDELEGTYYGTQLAAPYTPSSLQGLRSVLDVHYDAETVTRLLAENAATYLLHNQADLDAGIEDAEVRLEAARATPAGDGAIAPANHFLEDGIKVLRPVMVADSTVYDAVAGERLVPDYFARVDAMANRQDLFFALVQLSAVDAPASLTSLDPSNAFAVRTRIAGYRRLTESGQERLTFPTSSCLGNVTLIDEYRKLSRDSTTVENEYWMWWTNSSAYPGTWGCAYTGTLGETPRDGAVGWTSFRNYTLETVGQTFMHETGHILDADHGAAVTSQRCRVLGIFPFGVTGPSIMGGTSDRNRRANCFAITQPSATTLRNLTRVAEYLHANVP